MSGVDLLDRALSDLRSVIFGKKWYWLLIITAINIAFVYSWGVCRIISGEVLSQKEFRRRVVSIMIKRFASQIMDVRSRPARTFKVVDEIGLDGVEHYTSPAPLFPLQQAQYVQVFPLKLAPSCTLFAGLGSTNKPATSLLFSSYLTLVLSSPSCFLLHLSSYLKLSGRSSRNCLLSPPVLSGYNGSPDTRFSRGTTRLMIWPYGERYLRPPQSLVVSLLCSLLSTPVFSRTRSVLSHQNFSTHRFPRFLPRKLCSLVMLAVSSLVYAATDIAFC